MYRHICKYLYTFVHYSLVKCIEKQQQQQQQQQQQRQQRQRQLVEHQSNNTKKGTLFYWSHPESGNHWFLLPIVSPNARHEPSKCGSSAFIGHFEFMAGEKNSQSESHTVTSDPCPSHTIQSASSGSCLFWSGSFSVDKRRTRILMLWIFKIFKGGNRMRHTTFLCQQVGEL